MPKVVSNTGPLIALASINQFDLLQGLLTALKPWLEELRRAGFHMSNDLYRQVLDSAGETENSQNLP